MKGKTSLVVGGSGQLGRYVVSAFKRKGWRLISVDLRENGEADGNVVLSPYEKISDQIDKIYNEIAGYSRT